MKVFVIQHKVSGVYVQPEGGSSDPENDTKLILSRDLNSNMHWTLDAEEGPWGYIRHVAGGRVWHPSDGNVFPGNDTPLILHSERKSAAFFALDQVNNRIIHRGGKFVQPRGRVDDPSADTTLVLQGDEHEAMRFIFVDPSFLDKRIWVYGNPDVKGSWEIISNLQDPSTDNLHMFEYKVGRDKIESTTTVFTINWEPDDSFNFFSEGSTVESLSHMINKASSATWSGEQTAFRETPVTKGKPIVTWQYVFCGEYLGNKVSFRSNILVDTSSVSDVPTEETGQ